MRPSIRDVQVAVLRPPSVTESVLIPRIHGYVFNRPSDGKQFRILVADREESVHLEDPDYTLLEFDTSNSRQDDIVEVAYNTLRTSYGSLKDGCTVVTALTSPYAMYSETHLLVVGREVNVRRFGFNYITVSVHDGDGFDKLFALISDEIDPPIPSFGSAWSLYTRCLIRNSQRWTLDTIASICSLGVPVNVNANTPDELQLDDEAVDRLSKAPENQDWTRYLESISIFGEASTFKISRSLMAKWLDKDEYANMIFVRQHTSIPVPQPRYPHLKQWLVMDLVKGRMLYECWDNLSWFKQFRIACTLRGYVSQLRCLTSKRPGSLLSGRLLRSPLTDQYDSDYCFTSAREFQLWCEQVARHGWCRRALLERYRHERGEPLFLLPLPVIGRDNEWSTLVFTHGDLNPSNIILADDGVLWVIDWASGSFLPPTWEAVAVDAGQPNAAEMWKKYGWLITGVDPDMHEFWTSFASDAHRYIRTIEAVPKSL